MPAVLFLKDHAGLVTGHASVMSNKVYWIVMLLVQAIHLSKCSMSSYTSNDYGDQVDSRSSFYSRLV